MRYGMMLKQWQGKCAVCVNDFFQGASVPEEPALLESKLLWGKCRDCFYYRSSLLWLLKRRRVILLHASSVRMANGKYLLFCGSADTGKSTLLRLSKKVFTPHGNEFVLISRDRDTACFKRLAFLLQRPVPAEKVAAIYCLTGRASENAIQPLSFREAFLFLFKQWQERDHFSDLCRQVMASDAGAEDSLARDYGVVLRRKRFYKLSFKPSPEIISMIDRQEQGQR